VFTATAIAFFLAEIGDKTQIATMMLAAQFDNLIPVVAGTTLGMLIADVPVVYLGRAAGNRIPLAAVRAVAAVLFVVMAVIALVLPQPT
jgi:putative Ca2+/H+ antiporter (TMEM165/GDT1 family)